MRACERVREGGGSQGGGGSERRGMVEEAEGSFHAPVGSQHEGKRPATSQARRCPPTVVRQPRASRRQRLHR